MRYFPGNGFPTGFRRRIIYLTRRRLFCGRSVFASFSVGLVVTHQSGLSLIVCDVPPVAGCDFWMRMALSFARCRSVINYDRSYTNRRTLIVLVRCNFRHLCAKVGHDMPFLTECHESSAALQPALITSGRIPPGHLKWGVYCVTGPERQLPLSSAGVKLMFFKVPAFSCR